jgi:hypothetical protein
MAGTRVSGLLLPLHINIGLHICWPLDRALLLEVCLCMAFYFFILFEEKGFTGQCYARHCAWKAHPLLNILIWPFNITTTTIISAEQ